MHHEPQQFPQPDPADAGQPSGPALQNSAASTTHHDAPGMRAKAEAFGRHIERLEARLAAVPVPDNPLGEAGQKYDALVAWYNKHISAARAQLMGIRQS